LEHTCGDIIGGARLEGVLFKGDLFKAVKKAPNWDIGEGI